MSDPAIEISDLEFGWSDDAPVLKIAAFEVGARERVFLKGASGSGKSTLLGLVSGVLSGFSGKVRVLDHDVSELSAGQRDKMRADRLGVIFQLFNLVPYLSVVQNVTLPLRFSAARRARVGGDVEAEARRLLARLGLEDEAVLSRRVSDLSVGQQQRVAAARALIGGPSLVIADEPTSALDSDARDKFIALLSDEVARTQAALLFVSHDGALASQFDRSVDLSTINAARAQS